MRFWVENIRFSVLPTLMQRFFNDFDALNRFTLSLDSLGEKLQCPHCSKSNQLVSHGLIYKQHSIHKRETVGKRVFCSNRHNRSGCGQTVQLYLKDVIPSLQYGTAQVFVFLSLLLKNLSVKAAYQSATGQIDSRNAWRWIRKLTRNLTDYRCALNLPFHSLTFNFNHRFQRLRLLLSTLKKLFSQLPNCPCSYYQLTHQHAFI